MCASVRVANPRRVMKVKGASASEVGRFALRGGPAPSTDHDTL